MKQICIKLSTAIFLIIFSSWLDCAIASASIALVTAQTNLLSGGKTAIVLNFDQTPPMPTSFSLDNPSQMVFDFVNVTNALKNKQNLKKLASGIIQDINFVTTEAKTRMIIDVRRVATFTVDINANTLVITLFSDNTKTATDPAAPNNQSSNMQQTAAKLADNDTDTDDDLDETTENFNALASHMAATPTNMPQVVNYNINAIDFRRGEAGEGRLIIELGQAAAAIDFKESDNELVVEYKGATIPDRLLRRFDVSDFGTPIKQVVVLKQQDSIVFKIKAVGEYEKVAYQAKQQYIVEVKPLSEQEKENNKSQKFKFTGEHISLNFQDIEVRAVLQLLADFTGLNIIASDSVGGNVTLRLDNVPWDQALDFILKSKGLGKRASGNIILIAPNEEIAAKEQLELSTEKQAETLAPLFTEYLQINYAKAKDIEKILKTEGSTVLSSRGSVSVDERTNTLLVKDTQEKIVDIQKILDKLDIPIRQVLIEAQVVQTKDDFLDVFGVNLGGAARTKVGKYPIGIGGDINAAYRLARNTGNLGYQGDTGATSAAATAAGAAAGGANADAIKAASAAQAAATSGGNNNLKFFDLAQADAKAKIGFSIARLSSGTILDLELRASELEDKAKVLARPKLLTLDQQTASIETGQEIPYSVTGQNGATPTITFKKAVLKLEVTPQITPNNKVLMKLTISQDSVGANYNGQQGIDTTGLQTNILVENGETVVLGGIFKVTNNKKVNKIKWFCDIPFIGQFFRDKFEVNNRQEILIFVTPKIVKAEADY